MQSPTPDLAREEAPRESGVAHSGPRRWTAGSIFGALWPLGVIALLFLVDFPICPSRGLLGVPCPGCGLTRATFAMLRLDLAGMLRFHPLAPIMAPLFAFTLLRTSLVRARILRPDQWDLMRKIPTWLLASLLVAMLGLFIARLLGLLGGLPDPVDFHEGALGKAFTWLAR
jgi:hypothetical protein